MKKILFAVAGILASMTVSAQVWVGGSLGFASRSYDLGNSPVKVKSEANEIGINFSPTIGYTINEKMDAGIELTFNNVSNLGGVKDSIATSFGASPFVRFNFFQSGKISFLAQASIDFYNNTSKYVVGNENFEEKNTSLGAYVSPLIKYQVTDHIALVAKFAKLGLTKIKDKSTSIQLDVDSELNFGIYYAF